MVVVMTTRKLELNREIFKKNVKPNGWLVLIQDNVSEWSKMFVCGPLIQSASSLKIMHNAFVCNKSRLHHHHHRQSSSSSSSPSSVLVVITTTIVSPCCHHLYHATKNNF
jgi:hypothetical protein